MELIFVMWPLIAIILSFVCYFAKSDWRISHIFIGIILFGSLLCYKFGDLENEIEGESN